MIDFEDISIGGHTRARRIGYFRWLFQVGSWLKNKGVPVYTQTTDRVWRVYNVAHNVRLGIAYDYDSGKSARQRKSYWRVAAPDGRIYDGETLQELLEFDEEHRLLGLHHVEF